jgi:hypothetical protein
MAEDFHGMISQKQKDEAGELPAGNDIAKDIRARIADLNELLKVAALSGLRVDVEPVLLHNVTLQVPLVTLQVGIFQQL